MENLGYYNGKYDLIENMYVPMNDRACFFGDGIYEAAYARNYIVYALDEHIDRLFEGAAALDITVPGAMALKKSLKNDVVTVFIMPPSVEVLRQRLTDRNREGLDEIEKRIAFAVESELSKYLDYDYVVINNDLEKAAKLVKAFPLAVTGSLGFDYAQVTKGGVPMTEVDERLQSKFAQGLYFAGEMLDVDGQCGGFNLQWAYSSACAVYNALLSKIEKNTQRGGQV